MTIANGTSSAISQEIILSNPKLWNHLSPNLYTVHTTIKNGAIAVDHVTTRIGIRRIQWTRNNGFIVNGTSFKLRGVDVHQDVFGIANAMSNSALYYELKLIKEAGFDFIRCCHYPHDPAFYDACDSLGIFVMNALAGWHSFPNTTTFNNNTFKECRDMVRRDRNHPCVATWETSLNETAYNNTWAQQVHDFAHAEYPGDQMYTNGHRFTIFDIFSDAAGGTATQPIYNDKTTRPLIISEYGDYEYHSLSLSSRVKREAAEVALVAQAANHQRRMNLNRNETWLGVDCVWSWGDDGSAYAKGMFYGGVVDLYRLPKFTYYYYQSQRDAAESIPGVNMGPMVYIANRWQAGSPTTVTVFSNCESVSLYKNGTLVATKKPDTDANSTNIKHPPFTFTNVTFTSGTLKAEGLIGTTVRASHTRTTPGSASAVRLRNISNDPLSTIAGDNRLVWVDIVDANGTVVPTSSDNVTLSITGPATILGPTSIAMKGGQLATWIRPSGEDGSIVLTAKSGSLTQASLALREQTATLPHHVATIYSGEKTNYYRSVGKTIVIPQLYFDKQKQVSVYDITGKIMFHVITNKQTIDVPKHLAGRLKVCFVKIRMMEK